MYRLIAFDMDRTLLNSRKLVSERTKDAIARAAATGKIVAYCTGRSPIELSGFPEELPGMRYAICNNGAALWDVLAWRQLRGDRLDPGLILEILRLADSEEYLTQFYLEKMKYSSLRPEDLEKAGMLEYLPMYERLQVPEIPDLRERFAENPEPVEKLALHFFGKESRLRAMAKIRKAMLPVSMNFGNRYTLEFTVPSCNKGEGLRKLCEYLGIPLSEAIAVGDSENDNEAIQMAGLGIAMGNSTEELKGLADVLVADNDHDGCAEAIDRYLLAP